MPENGSLSNVVKLCAVPDSNMTVIEFADHCELLVRSDTGHRTRKRIDPEAAHALINAADDALPTG